MDTVLGLLGVALFIPCVISLAAGVTWLVVRIVPPSRNDGKDKPEPAS